MQTIKITTTAKGEFHWEIYLMQKQESRLLRYLDKLEIDPWTRRDVITLLKLKCDKTNIIPLCQHPINIFLHALLDDNLESLLTNSTVINTDKLKEGLIKINFHNFINFKAQYLRQTNYANLVTDFYLMNTGNRPLNINP